MALNVFSSLSGVLKNLSRAKIRKPVFIVGCGRSGTTLLFDVLSTHPGLARTHGYPDGEDHEGWIKHGKCVMAGIGNIHHSNYGNGINGQQYCLHMTKDDLTHDIVRDMHDYFWREVLFQDSRRRVINKQPHLSNKLDYVLGIFPDAKIIHIIRDCEPMVASWLAALDGPTLPLVYWPADELFPCFWLMPKPKDPAVLARLAQHPRFFPGGGAGLWVDYWCEINIGIEKQMEERRSQLLAIRYEDLIAKPHEVLGRILSFCELPEFEFKVTHLEKNTAQKHKGRITSNLKEIIAIRAKTVRQAFHYEPQYNVASPWSLFLP